MFKQLKPKKEEWVIIHKSLDEIELFELNKEFENMDF